MPFWKKAYNKRNAVYFPQTIVQGKPVETETIAKDSGGEMEAPPIPDDFSLNSNKEIDAILLESIFFAHIAL